MGPEGREGGGGGRGGESCTQTEETAHPCWPEFLWCPGRIFPPVRETCCAGRARHLSGICRTPGHVCCCVAVLTEGTDNVLPCILLFICIVFTVGVPCIHGGRRQPMCDPEGCSTVWGAVGGGGGPPPPSEGGGGPSPPPWLTQTQHLFRQAPSKRANTQS